MAFSINSASDYLKNSFSPSESSALADSFIKADGGTIGGVDYSKAFAASNLDNITDVAFKEDLDLGSLVGLDSSKFLGGLAETGGWTFITAPEEVSWDVANQASRVDIFGTNNPPVVAGSRGMRDLQLSNALVEGFVRNVNVEAKVAALENLMNYQLNSSDGFVSVPVYQVWANNKSYGGSNGYFIIKDIKVKETMRDLTGNSTRAYVDISLMQVPEYQVNSGRDQASQTLTAAGGALEQNVKGQGNQNVVGAKGGTTASNPASQPKSGPGTPPPQTQKPQAVIPGQEIRYQQVPK
jgi:hypothetical protein